VVENNPEGVDILRVGRITVFKYLMKWKETKKIYKNSVLFQRISFRVSSRNLPRQVM
jgi:hypothetical protein